MDEVCSNVQTIISIIISDIRSYHIQHLLRTLLLSPVCTAMKIRKKIKDAFFIFYFCRLYVVRTLLPYCRLRITNSDTRQIRLRPTDIRDSPNYVFCVGASFGGRIKLRTLPLLSSPLSYRIYPLLSCPLLSSALFIPYRVVLYRINAPNTIDDLDTYFLTQI